MAADFIQDFALDVRSLSVLASLQSDLIDRDVAHTSQRDTTQRKRRWKSEWEAVVRNGFQAMETTPKPTIWQPGSPELLEGLKVLREAPDRLKAGLVLLELATFGAYWPLEKDQKDFKGLSLDGDVHKEFLRAASRRLGFDADRGEQLRGKVEEAQKGLTDYWWKVAVALVAGLGLGALTFGIAAPFIGGWWGVAILGLRGAAATSAGLAAIGGGAVVAGGLGMAGGMAVLVGGGAILGIGLGAAAGFKVAEVSAGATLLSSAKLEVVLKELILLEQRDIAKLQEILMAQQQSIHVLEEELAKQKFANTKSEDRIKELEESIKILRKALERNWELVPHES